MSRCPHPIILWCFLIAAVWLLPAAAQPKEADNDQPDIGRDDPFSPLRTASKTQGRAETPDTDDREQKPELFVETVTLKFLSAASLAPAIENMSSELGSITTDEQTNSLIITDIKENLARIIEQVKKADKIPSQSVLVETISLKFLNVESVKEAIKYMSSEYGSMSVDVKNNSLLVRDTKDVLESIKQEVRKIDKPQQIMFVETAMLKFLDAKNLKAAVEKMLSQYGTIEVDENTNSLIICDTRDKVDSILIEVRKADKTPPQIMVEVVIVDVQLDDDTEIGVNWDRLFEKNRDVVYEQTLADSLDTAGVIGGDFSILKAGISGTIHALQKVRDVEILASPRVLVVSGEQAFIQTVEEIPYIELTGTAEGGSEALSSTEFKEAGITLTVKATVTDDNKILLTVKPEQSVKTDETGVGSSTVPVLDKRITETTLLMEDGQVLVMGGLRKKETRISTDKVPLLGDLPVIGHLFSDRKTVVKHSELLVFLSPHIYKERTLTDEELERFNQLREMPMLALPKNNDTDKDTSAHKDNNEDLLSILTSLEKKLSR